MARRLQLTATLGFVVIALTAGCASDDKSSNVTAGVGGTAAIATDSATGGAESNNTDNAVGGDQSVDSAAGGSNINGSQTQDSGAASPSVPPAPSQSEGAQPSQQAASQPAPCLFASLLSIAALLIVFAKN